MDNPITSTFVNNLPPEILALVYFSYVESEGHGKLCSVLGKVSKLWHDAILHPKLWVEVSFATEDFQHGYTWLKDKDVLERLLMVKTLNLSSNHAVPRFFSQALLQILKNSSNLENFNYTGSSKISRSLVYLSTLCPNIKTIRIKFVGHKLLSQDMLCAWLERYSMNLTSLSLYNVVFKSFNVTMLSWKLSACCPNLTHLELNAILNQVSKDDLFDLNALQAGCQKMRELSLIRIDLLPNDDLISCFRYLRKFRFKPCNDVFYSKGIQNDIFRVLRGSAELVELDVRDINLSMKTLLRLPCKYLKRLRFQCYTFQPSGLYETLCQWRYSLAELHVSCCNQSLQFLFQYIEEYGKDNLESLWFCSSSIDITKLKEIVRQCAKLNYLSFKKVPISDEKEVFSTHDKITEWLKH